MSNREPKPTTDKNKKQPLSIAEHLMNRDFLCNRHWSYSVANGLTTVYNGTVMTSEDFKKKFDLRTVDNFNRRKENPDKRGEYLHS